MSDCTWLADGPVAVADIVPTAAYREVRAAVLAAWEQGIVFSSVTGESGSGKSLLCRDLTETETDRWCPIWIPQRPAATRRGLFRSILALLDADGDEALQHDEATTRLELLRLAEERAAAGTPCVLLVDEVEKYPFRLLDELRSLTNYLVDDNALFRVVLIGGREFERTLLTPAYESIADRLGLEASLRSLSAEETLDYLNVQVARGDVDVVFTEDAVVTIADAAPMPPQLADRVADLAIATSTADGRADVTVEDVLSVWDSLDRRAEAVVDSPPHGSGERDAMDPVGLESEMAGDDPQSIVDCEGTAADVITMECEHDEEATMMSGSKQTDISENLLVGEELETASFDRDRFAPLDGVVVEIGAEAATQDAAAQTDPMSVSANETADSAEEAAAHAMETAGECDVLPTPLLGDFVTDVIFDVPSELESMTIVSDEDTAERLVVDPYDEIEQPSDVSPVALPTEVADGLPHDAVARTLELIDQTIEVIDSEDVAAEDALHRLLEERDGGLETSRGSEAEQRSDAPENEVVAEVAHDPTEEAPYDPSFDYDLIQPKDFSVADEPRPMHESDVSDSAELDRPSPAPSEADQAMACLAAPTVEREETAVSLETVDEPDHAAVQREQRRQADVLSRGFSSLFSTLRRR